MAGNGSGRRRTGDLTPATHRHQTKVGRSMEEGDAEEGQRRARRWPGTAFAGSAEGSRKATGAGRRRTPIGGPSTARPRPAPAGRTRGADLRSSRLSSARNVGGKT
eukprot:235263-Heterocapsa_arctica.AAC.1